MVVAAGEGQIDKGNEEVKRPVTKINHGDEKYRTGNNVITLHGDRWELHLTC